MRNLELKVAVEAGAFEEIVRRARKLGASVTVSQVDTYFAVPSGRLKLREISEGSNRRAELIGYSRPNEEGARWSEYYRADFRPEQIAPLIAMMKQTIGVRTVVSKEREVVVTGRTRIHLDQVEGLGRFVELETVVGEEPGDSGADQELADVAGMLGLYDHPVVAGSYSDLIEPGGEA
ncbi:MAG: class IV adenylate cyclase [Thermomicrobiales bacterium]|nr:class IV adenylate cyclase [Thermomicrobiales bacterium]